MKRRTTAGRTRNTVTVNQRPNPADLKNPALYINRELSALEFQRRVLARADNADLPLFDRLEALAHFCHNLDEFFMVRVMNLEEEAAAGKRSSGPDKLKLVNVLATLRRRIAQMQKNGEALWFNDIKPGLENAGIRFLRYRDLTARQQKMANDWFDREVFPLLTPQAVDRGRPMPMISGISLNFAVEIAIDRRRLARAQSYGSEEDENIVTRFARVKCPTDLPRFLFLPETPEKGEKLDINNREGQILLLEELIEARIDRLFPGCKVLSKGRFRVTRNTEGEILEVDAKDLLDAVRDFVDTRRFGSCVRLEFEYGMPTALQDFVRESLGIRPSRVVRSKLPLAFGNFLAITRLARPELRQKRLEGRLLPGFNPEEDIFSVIRQNDRVLFHPYESFMNTLQVITAAADDPMVTGIKHTLYRTCPHSPIIEDLMRAHKKGKEVTVVVELKARFNEKANIGWAERLEEEGIHVVYGFANKKIHAKATLIIREEADEIRRYTHIATGNYNGETAATYGDIGLLTADETIADDVGNFFNALSGFGSHVTYRDIMVSPDIMTPGLTDLIDEEIALHATDGKGHIVLKCNQLVDPPLIRALYRASQAGVRIDCIVRGICCLRPGVPGISENIRVRTIVGRIHEHSRAYYFRHGGEKRLYIGSADLMDGNFTKRIELLVPIKDRDASHRIRHAILKPQLADTALAWELHADGTYSKCRPAEGEKALDSQKETAKWLKREAGIA